MGLNLSARMNERSRSNVWGPSTLAHQAKKHCAIEHMQADVYGALLQVGMFVHLQIQTGISTGTLPLGKRAQQFNMRSKTLEWPLHSVVFGLGSYNFWMFLAVTSHCITLFLSVSGKGHIWPSVRFLRFLSASLSVCLNHMCSSNSCVGSSSCHNV